jgi:hypothetical protein
MLDGFHKLFRLIRIIKGKLAAGNAAIHVVSSFGNKEARLSRHGMPPMRGRDKSILLSRRHRSTIKEWCHVSHCHIRPPKVINKVIRGTHPSPKVIK